MSGRLFVIVLVVIALLATAWAWWLRTGRIDSPARPPIPYSAREGR